MIYLDNAATTKISGTALEAMMPYLTEDYGNPSSVYGAGRTAKKAVENARDTVARLINASSASEIVFTGSGTEGSNWALKGIADALEQKGRHMITTKIEHHAVLNTFIELEKKGYEVTYLDAGENGVVSPDDVKNALRPDTILISVMFANNEIGTIQPIREIGQIAEEAKVLFYTDAVQAAGHLPIDVQSMGIDLLSLSAHKFHGPKGVGVLYIKRGIRLPQYFAGGGQERNRRAGTENVAGIVGLAAALEESVSKMPENSARIQKMRDKIIEGVLKIPNVRLNGDPVKRLPNNANFAFEFIEGESLLLMLDMKGICASSGSACTSGSLDPSHVLIAIGLPHEIAHGSLRVSLSEYNTDDDVNSFLDTLPSIVERLREMSPLTK